MVTELSNGIECGFNESGFFPSTSAVFFHATYHQLWPLKFILLGPTMDFNEGNGVEFKEHTRQKLQR